MTAPLAGALLGLLGGNAPASGAPAEPSRCDAPCGEGAVPCCTEVGLHGSGAPIAWLRRGAPIPITMAQGTGLSDPEGTRPEAVVADLKRWLIGHSELAGLAPMADPSPLAGLVAWPRAPLRFGGIEVIRALQTYRGLPIWGAGETVSLTVSSPRLTVSSSRPTVSSPGGIVAIHGAIADARETYAGWEAPIGEDAALIRAQVYLAALADAGDPPRYTAASPQWVAIVEIRAMAYTFEVWDRGVTSPGEELAATQAGERSQEHTPPRRPRKIGSLALRADNGLVLAMDFDLKESHQEPEPEAEKTLHDLKVRVRALDSQKSDPFILNDPEKNLADLRDAVLGDSLRGATYMPLACREDPAASPQCGQIRLGGPEVVVVDAHKNASEDHDAPYTVPTDPAGEFLAHPPALATDPYTPESRAASHQDAYYRLTAASRLFAPVKAGRWDSLWRWDSDFAPEAFVPRLVYFFDVTDCPANAPGCAGIYFPREVVDGKVQNPLTYYEHPWTDIPPHRPPGGRDEGMGAIRLRTESFRSPSLLFHEYGHILDLFTAARLLGDQVIGSGCMTDEETKETVCTAACAPDTTDEAEALGETFADLIAAFTLARLYPSVTYTSHCEAISQIAAGQVFTPVHDPTCVSDPSQIRRFDQERPSQPGYYQTGDGPIPSGICSKSPGYRQRALLSAWWEWIHGRSCETTAPYTCEFFSDENTAATAGIEALLYALSLTNQTFYKQFLTDAETYLSCTYGDTLAARWREVWCHHGALECGAMPSPCPATCGDGLVQGDEDCDLQDMSGNTCESLGFSGGSLVCTADCTLDTAGCTSADATTGEGPTTGDPPTGGSDSATTSPGTGGLGEPGGCACAAEPEGRDPARGSLWLLLVPALLGLRRPRRRLDRVKERA